MRKIILILVVVALIMGYFAYLVITSDTTPPAASSSTTIDEAIIASQPLSGVGTLADLQTRDQNLECQIIYETNQYEGLVEGSYFISNGRVRGDFVIPAADLGGQIISSTITTDSEIYVWSEIGDETFGFRYDTDVTYEADIAQSEPVPKDVRVRFNCIPWDNVDGSIFVPPAGVEFRDSAAIIEAGMEYGIEF